MFNTHYRAYQDRDAAAVKRIVDEAFRIHRYAPTPHLLHSALEVYLRDCLLASGIRRFLLNVKAERD